MRYWGRGSRASADLKQVYKRVRAARPEFFIARNVRSTEMGDDGKVTTTNTADVRAVPMSPERRHQFSTKKV